MLADRDFILSGGELCITLDVFGLVLFWVICFWMWLVVWLLIDDDIITKQR